MKWPSPSAFLAALAVALIIVHGLWAKTFVIDTTTLGLLVILLVLVLRPYLESAKLGDLAELTFREQLRTAEENAAARIGSSEGAASDGFKAVAEALNVLSVEHPDAAIAGTRVALEQSLRTLWREALPGVQCPAGTRLLVRELAKRNVIDQAQAQAIRELLDLIEQAQVLPRVLASDASRVVDLARQLTGG